MKNAPLSRKANIVLQEMGDEILIYDLSANKVFCLNETSALVWQLCDGQKTPSEISQIITQNLRIPANEDLIWLTLELLKKENLIENKNDLENYFQGMSRREVIKKVGLGSVAALPIVASVMAPMAAEAATCIGPINRVLGMACDQNCQCNSGCCGGFGTCGISGLGSNIPCLVDCNCSSGVCASVMLGMATLMLCA